MHEMYTQKQLRGLDIMQEYKVAHTHSLKGTCAKGMTKQGSAPYPLDAVRNPLGIICESDQPTVNPNGRPANQCADRLNCIMLHRMT